MATHTIKKVDIKSGTNEGRSIEVHTMTLEAGDSNRHFMDMIEGVDSYNLGTGNQLTLRGAKSLATRSVQEWADSLSLPIRISVTGRHGMDDWQVFFCVPRNM